MLTVFKHQFRELLFLSVCSRFFLPVPSLLIVSEDYCPCFSCLFVFTVSSISSNSVLSDFRYCMRRLLSL